MTMQNKIIDVVFEVEKIIHRNEANGFTVIKAKFSKYEHAYLPTREIIITCNYLGGISVEDEFKAEGKWIYKNNFGHQFQIENMELIMPTSVKGIQEYLRKKVKGVQSKTLKKITSTYQESALEKIMESPDNLTMLKISKATADKIYNTVKADYMFENVYPFLRSHQIPNKQMIMIYEALGDETKRLITENPYCICNIPKIAFNIADKVAFNLNVAFDNKERVYHGIQHYIHMQMKNQGHLFVYKDKLIEELPQFLTGGAYKQKQTISEKVIEETLQLLSSIKKIAISENEQGKKCIYLSYFFYVENQIVKLLKEHSEAPKLPICKREEIEEFVDNYEKINKMTLATNQRKALSMAIMNSLSVLTGGPGTGKTQTINTIIKCIETVNPYASIVLCAPTGRASKRMTELSGRKASTIHRLIGLNGFTNEKELREVQADFLIVDEFSMVDAHLFYTLLSAISENTRVLLVGDYHQLPSVGPGLILRDLIHSQCIPVTTLNEIFRQAGESQIVTNSHKIIQGINSQHVEGLTFNQEKEDFYFVRINDAEKICQETLRAIQNLVTNKNVPFSSIQVLAPMNKGDLGVESLNAKIQEMFNPTDRDEVRISPTTVIRYGDKVIQNVNNYDIQAFNGEVGEVVYLWTENNDYEIVVDFGDRTVCYSPENAHELQLAYAITIHKSQGSEFPVVIMPIHSSQQLLLNRNTVYTGITRAKQKVVLLGSIKELDKAILKTDNTVRNSMIEWKLRKNLSKVAV